MSKYTRIRGRTLGPFDETQLAEMIRQGTIGRQTEVSDDKKTWVKAKETSLFDSPGPRPRSRRRKESEEVLVTDDNEVVRSGRGTPEWFLSNDGITGTGPYSVDEVLSMLKSQSANSNTLAWKQGGTAKPLFQISEFSQSGEEQEDDIPIQVAKSPTVKIVSGPEEKATCPFCEKEVALGASFCPYCGEEQPKTMARPRTTTRRCPECGTPIDSTASNCSRCGALVPVQASFPKSKMVYMLLAIFLGLYGIHNFYAGYKTKAILQLLFTLSILGAIVAWIWGLMDAFTVNEDGEGGSFT